MAEKPADTVKDISTLATPDLVKAYAKLEASLETAVRKEVAKQLKSAPAPEAEWQKAERDFEKSLLTAADIIHKRALEKFGPEAGEKKFREVMERDYKNALKVQENPEEFRKRVDTRKKLLGSAVSPADVLWAGDAPDAQIIPLAGKGPRGVGV